MPAHVTLLYPFAQAHEVDLAGLGSLFAAAEPFAYTLVGPAEWPADGVVYLDPRPAEPFVELTRLIVSRFPGYRPYRGKHELDELQPHLTVVHTDNAGARADAAASVAASLPIECSADEVWLVHEVNGRWQRHTPFRLGR
jgi:hypothetical protein